MTQTQKLREALQHLYDAANKVAIGKYDEEYLDIALSSARHADRAIAAHEAKQAQAVPSGEPVAWYEYNESLDAWFLAYSHNPKAKTRPLVFGDVATTPTPPATDAGVVEDAERWREVLNQVGADRQCGGFRFTLYNLRPEHGTNPMKGAVCQHFTKAIDAARAARAKVIK